MPRRSLVLTFGLLTGVFAAGYGVMFTVLDDFRDEYGISETALGGIVAIGFFASFLAQLFIAPMADRGHARRLVAVGMIINVVGLVVMAFSSTVALLLLARFVLGVGAGMAVPAIRRIVVLAEPERLGNNLGRLISADVAGFALGPAVSAVLVGPFGLAAPFLVIAAATIACMPVILRVHVDEADAAPRTRLALDLLRVRPFAAAVAMGAAVYLMIGTFDALWVLVLSDLGTADWIANVGISIFALPLVFLAAIGGRAAQRIGPFRLGSVGLLGASLFMFLYGQMPTGAAMMAVGVCHAIVDGLTVSSTGVAVGMVAPSARQAGAQGVLGAVQTLTGGITAVVAGMLYETSGRAVAYTACAAAMVALVGLSLALAGPARRLRAEPELAAPATVG